MPLHMIAIADYGAGNLLSVLNAMKHIGASCRVTADASEIRAADGVILPGVGSFGDAMNCMSKSGLVDAVKAAALCGKPFLGICLGLQLLFERSEESPGVEGLGILKGEIRRIPDKGLKVPHMGWNSLDIKNSGGLYRGLAPEPYVYFVHSYYLSAADESQVSAKTVYGVPIDASVAAGSLFGVQFHPEKSGDTGIQMLRNFHELCGGA